LGYQVERVLQMAKFDQGDVKFQFREVSMHEIIESVITNFNLQVETMKGMLIPSLHAENDSIIADTVHMTNVIQTCWTMQLNIHPKLPKFLSKPVMSHNNW